MSGYVAWRRIDEATTAACTCGGMGPEDPGVCPACVIYHRLKARAVTFHSSGGIWTRPAREKDLDV